MKPEEKSEIILWDWFKNNSTYVQEVYFNRTNKINSPTFQIKGGSGKPDLIISFDKGYGIQYIIIEVKNSKDSRNVHDAGKILRYYEEYIGGESQYFIDDKEIKINHFVIATENSIKGKLFSKDDDMIKNIDNQEDQWRNMNAKYSYIPNQEFIRTSDFQRRLWAEWRNLKKRLKLERIKLPSIGIIISSPKEDNLPYLFIMVWVDWLNSKHQWRQRFFKI